jgi:hypothetical protein
VGHAVKLGGYLPVSAAAGGVRHRGVDPSKKHFIRSFFLSMGTGSCPSAPKGPLNPPLLDSAGTTICTATLCNRHVPAHVHDAAGPPKKRREIKVYRQINP